MGIQPYYTQRSPVPPSVAALNVRLAAPRSGAPPTVDEVLSLRPRAPLKPLPRRATVDKQGTDVDWSRAAQLTTDAAVALLEEKAIGLGADDAPDVLAVSYSGHDIVAHEHGPQSAELYATTLAEDRELSRLLRTVARVVPGGLGSTLIAFIADHGGPAIPEDLAALGQPARVVDIVELRAKLSAHLERTFGGLSQGRPWFAAWLSSSLWLNPAVAASDSARRAEVLAETKRYVLESFGDVYVDAATATERAAGGNCHDVLPAVFARIGARRR